MNGLTQLASELKRIFCAATFAVPKGEQRITLTGDCLIAPDGSTTEMPFIVRLKNFKWDIVRAGKTLCKSINAFCSTCNDCVRELSNVIVEVEVRDRPTANDCKFHYLQLFGFGLTYGANFGKNICSTKEKSGKIAKN